MQRVSVLRREEVLANDEHISVWPVLVMPRPRLARPDQRFQGGLKLLRIGLGLLVQNDEIDGQALQAPVLVSAEELADDPSILGFVDPDQDDREVTRDPVRPQGGGARRIAVQHLCGGPEGGVGVQDPTGQTLEQMGLIRPDPEMM